MAEDYTPYSGAYTGAQIDSILAKANASESYTTAEKTKLSTLFNYDDTLVKADISDLKSDKVDKVSGKGLSTNDYTTTDKTKLSGIEDEANKTVVDSSLSSTSTNPVRNSTVKIALDTKVNKVNGKGLSTNDYTTAEKNKLASLSNYDDTELRSSIATKATVNDIFGTGIAITENSDLNDYTDSGNYYTTNISITATITNSPFTANRFKLLVFRTSSASEANVRCTQILFPQSSVVGFFLRHCVNGTWTSWYKFDGEVVT